MRKFTFFLMLLFAFVATGVQAQDSYTIQRLTGYDSSNPITDPATLSDGQAIVFKHVSSGKVLKIDPASKFVDVTAAAPGAADLSSGFCVFRVHKAEGGYTFESALDGYYMPAVNYDNGSKVYVEQTDSPVTYTINASSTEGQFVITSTVAREGDSNPGSFDMANGTQFTGWHGSGGNCNYQIIPVTMGSGDEATVEIAQVAYTYKLGGDTYRTAQVWQAVGGEPSAPAIDFVAIDAYTPTTAIAAGSAYDVTCSENLPFEVTTDASAPKAYAFHVHKNNGKEQMWQYDGDDEAISTVTKHVADVTAPADNMLWYLMGDLMNGFKIYNVAAGSDKPLTEDTDAPHVKAGEGTLWKLTKDTTNGGVCFNTTGSYINHTSQDKLGYYAWPDGGSGNFFYAPASFEKNYLQTVIDGMADTGYPEGAVGGYTYLENDANVQAIRQLLEGYEANKFDASYFGTHAQQCAASADVLTEGYYRVVNKSYSNVLTAVAGGLYATTANLDAAKSVAGTVVRFTANSDGTFKLSAQGKLFGPVSQSNTVQYTEDGADYRVVNTSGKTFTLQGGSSGFYAYLHCANHPGIDNVVGWEAAADASCWYIVPATELEVALTSIEGASYATAYLPFPVQTDGATKAYAVATDPENENVLNPMEMRDNIVPAGAGVILKNDSGATSTTLAITDCDAIFVGMLSGTFLPIEGITKTDYYIFGYTEDGGLGFYRPDATTLAANKAFINDAATLSAPMLKLNFGDTVTGIDAAIGNDVKASEPVFDLQGRRVQKAAKGIYIRGGKKIYVK